MAVPGGAMAGAAACVAEAAARVVRSRETVRAAFMADHSDGSRNQNAGSITGNSSAEE